MVNFKYLFEFLIRYLSYISVGCPTSIYVGDIFEIYSNKIQHNHLKIIYIDDYLLIE